MKKLLASIASFVITFSSIILFSCGHKDDSTIVVPESPTVKDKDGNEYKIVKIGSQTWMAENLRANANVGVTSCYANKADSCLLTGRLYDSTAMASNPCPNGWHVPNDNEWSILEKYIGMSDAETSVSSYGYRGTQAAKLKKDSVGNVGFNLIFGGAYSTQYGYYQNGTATYLWASDKLNPKYTNYTIRAFLINNPGIYKDDYTGTLQNLGACIRCIKSQ